MAKKKTDAPKKTGREKGIHERIEELEKHVFGEANTHHPAEDDEPEASESSEDDGGGD